MPPRSTTDCEEMNLGWESASAEGAKPEETQPQGKKTVTFAPTAKVRQVAKMTKSQAKDIWFTPNDFTKMKQQFAPTVQRMTDGTLTQEEMKGEEHCFRGLEYRTKEGARKRLQNKMNGISTVLHEQDRQIFEDTPDPELLAKVYMEATAQCRHEAIVMGAQDALDIQAYLLSEDDEYDEEDAVFDFDCSIRSSGGAGFDCSTHSASTFGSSKSKNSKRSSKKGDSGEFPSGSLSWKGPSTNSGFSFRGLRRVLSGGKKEGRRCSAA